MNFTAEVNTGSEERFGHITVSVSDQLYKVFTVAQRSGALAVTKTDLSYGLKGGEEGFVANVILTIGPLVRISRGVNRNGFRAPIR